jgi:flagellar biosynthetic protein FlhB
MSEDRTQAPSRRRLQQARERGQVAHSPELTGAVGLLAAAVSLSFWGEGLARAMLSLMREPLLGATPISADAAEVVARLRHLALGVAWPFGLILGAFAVAALAAHQAQVQGLWAPVLLAPDFSRLWRPGQGPDLAARGTRGLWGLIKTAVIAAVAAWAIRSEWGASQRLGGLDAPNLALAAGLTLRHFTLTLATAILGLGLIDFALQYVRFEAMLRLTPEEQREDIRSTEGDPVLRAHRRRLARTWRGDAPEVLAGASLVLTGPAGLTVVLAGGPPPRRVLVRSIVNGPAGDRVRRAAEKAGLNQVAAPDLARGLAQRQPPSQPPTPEQLAELAAVWLS